MHTRIPAALRLTTLLLLLTATARSAPIDRHALVTRHNVELHQFDANNPLSVGNGEFCFTVDVTGLQTFPEAFEQTTPRGSGGGGGGGQPVSPQTGGWDFSPFPIQGIHRLQRP